MSRAAEQFVSRGDYLSLERETSVRHEWVGGQLWAMTGGSGVHNRLAGRLFARLLPGGEAAGCRTYIADMKVVTENAGYYPDVMVVCDAAQPGEYHEEHPCLIAEVTSKSTGDRDRREKWVAYRSIASLRHYVLISQSERLVEHRVRTGDEWSTELVGSGETLVLTCPVVSIPVDELYDGLVGPPPTSAEAVRSHV